MHCFLTDESSERYLIDELRRAFPDGVHEQVADQWVSSDAAALEAPLAFARQTLPNATVIDIASINAAAGQLLSATLDALPEGQPWRLAVVPAYGFGTAGTNRCQLITSAFRERLQKKRRALLRNLTTDEGPFDAHTSFVQLYLIAPDKGVLSVAPAPLPYEARRNVWPFAKGELPIAVDKAAPSRAFSKVVEAEQRLGLQIAKGDTCVDLGASPGSWSYVAIHRGAHVTSIDRSPLLDDLMRHPRLTFQQGDAFKFKPAAPVDWLLCDVIAAPERNIGLLLDWVRERRARRFIVSIKFKGDTEYPLIDQLKADLPAHCSEFYLTRLCANKNEVCAFGIVRE